MTPEQIAKGLTKAQRVAFATGTFIVSGQAEYRNGRWAMRAHSRVLYNLRLKGLLNDYIGTPLLSDMGIAVLHLLREKQDD